MKKKNSISLSNSAASSQPPNTRPPAQISYIDKSEMILDAGSPEQDQA